MRFFQALQNALLQPGNPRPTQGLMDRCSLPGLAGLVKMRCVEPDLQYSHILPALKKPTSKGNSTLLKRIAGIGHR